MGTHPIFESDFDCLTDGMAAHKGLRNKLILAKKQKRTDRFLTGSDSRLITKSSTTLRDVTGAEPRLACKSYGPYSGLPIFEIGFAILPFRSILYDFLIR